MLFVAVIILLWTTLFFVGGAESNLEVMLAVKNIPKNEYNALYDIYFSLNGPYWRWNNDSKTIPWNFTDLNANPCSQKWQGLSCNCLQSQIYCYIEEIELSAHNLTGRCPDTFAQFSYLNVLLISRNNVSGTIPSVLFDNLTALTRFDIRSNQFVGRIPGNINRLSQLQLFAVETNFLSGTIPEGLYQLSNIELLFLQNNLLNGTISSSIGNLSSLREMSLSSNDLTGSLPSTLGKLQELLALDIRYNLLKGKIPSSVGSLSKLLQLGLTGNRLSQSIPAELGNLTRLRTLNLDLNDLTGSIPVSLGYLPQMYRLFLNGNNLFGSLPAEFFQADNSSILVLSLGSNLFSGGIPSSIKEWKDQLEYLDLSRNSLYGTLPIDYFELFPRFRAFLINVNFFEGAITNPLPQSPAVLVFSVGSNAFTGTVPVSSGWTLITNYLAYDAYFSTTIPEQFISFKRMNYMEISDNYLIGTIPSGISELPLLGYLNLTNNLLTGRFNYTITDETTFARMTQLSLSYNRLTGPIPTALGKLTNLNGLALNDNYFTGSIPQGLRYLINLQVLLLQNNRITGQLYDFKIYQLQNLDVSGNLLTGTLPEITTLVPSLKTFAASSNCITGSIPESFCVSSLSVLTLDGLSTATNCRTEFFPNSDVFNAFYVDSYLRNGIPSCLFSMASIETLHLSGNGLTGSLPSNINISDSLTDLLLSHNQLSGSIPLAIQRKAWTRLELSYNKFSGTLSNDFHNYDADGTSLSLKINRLSGDIPSSLISAKDIDILEGNIFSCNVDRTGLPKNDDTAQTYSCGSDVVNDSIYIWIGANGFFLIALYLLIRTSRIRNRRKKKQGDLERASEEVDGDEEEIEPRGKINRARRSSRASIATALLAPNMEALIERITRWRRRIVHFTDEDENTQIAIASIHVFLKPLRRFIFRIVMFTLFVLGFVYIGISLSYNAYAYPCAWTYSAIFLSGETPAIALLIPLFVLLMIVIHLYRVMVENPSALFTGDYRISKRFFKFLKSMNRINEEEKLMIYCVLVVVAIANFLIMMVVDIVYVIIILSYSPVVVIITEISLSIFKLWFNNVVLWKVFPLSRKYLKPFFLRLTNNRPESSHTESGAIQMNTFAASIPTITEEKVNRPESIDLSGHSSSSLSSAHSALERTTSASSVSSVSPLLDTPTNAYEYSRTELLFLARTVVFNNILLPVLAIFIVNPECFYNTLYAADVEKTNYNYEICDRYSHILDICQDQLILFEESSYTPPFIYGYECAANVLVNYVPVFIMMYTWEGFLSPLLKMTLKFVIDRLFNDESQILATVKPGSGSVVSGSGWNLSDISHSPRSTEEQKSSTFSASITNNATTQSTSIFSKSSWLFRFLNSLLPDNLQDFTPLPPKDQRPRTFFDKNRLAVKINTGLVVLISFGALFPPLAFIVGFGIITLTVYEETVIGRLLYESERLGYSWYKKQLERDCYGLAESLKYTLWSIIPVSSLLFAYLIFDTWGDAEGWLSALPATVLMGTLPTLILIGVIYGPETWRYVRLRVRIFMNRSTVEKSGGERPPVDPESGNNVILSSPVESSISKANVVNMNRPLPTPNASSSSTTNPPPNNPKRNESLTLREDHAEINNPMITIAHSDRRLNHSTDC